MSVFLLHYNTMRKKGGGRSQSVSVQPQGQSFLLSSANRGGRKNQGRGGGAINTIKYNLINANDGKKVSSPLVFGKSSL